MSSRAIFLNGTAGVGKTTVLDHVGDLLAEVGEPFGLLDVDWFHRYHPPNPGDPGNRALEGRGLAAVARGYLEHGPRTLVVSGVITSAERRADYADVLGVPMSVVWLRLAPAEVAQRLQRRHARQPQHLPALLRQGDDFAVQIAAAHAYDHVLDIDGLTAREAAERVLALVR